MVSLRNLLSFGCEPERAAGHAPVASPSYSRKLHKPESMIGASRTEAPMAKKIPQPEKRFTEMHSGEKVRFLGKALVFFVSGGFVFPTMWID